MVVIRITTLNNKDNGQSTLFWDHIWATDVPIVNLATSAIPNDVVGATVQEMWEEGVGWKWELFSQYLPNCALQQIAAHELFEDPKLGDLVYWKGNSKGKFSIKHALRLIRDELHSPSSNQWDAIWKAPVQQRIRAFLWLINHEKILCNTNRVKRKLSDDPTCPRCQTDEENLLHLFRDCPAARNIWQCVGGAAHYNSFYTGSFNQWLFRNLKAEGLIFSEKWPTFFAITLWWNWCWRNCVVFNNSKDIPINIGVFLHARGLETWNIFNGAQPYLAPAAPNSLREEIYVRWKAPPEGWFVLNTDGAVKDSPGPAGGGGAIRDNQRRIIRAFSANLGICSSFRAELKAALYGLDLEKKMGITRLIMQMDNSACVQMLSDDVYNGGECHFILNACRELVKHASWQVRVEHCYREGNKVADHLANVGVQQQERFSIIQELSTELRTLIMNDSMGVTTPRVINLIT